MSELVSIDCVKLYSFKKHEGVLVVYESKRDVPFEIRRIFTISGANKGDVRGHHAHRKCHQGLVCLSGAISVVCDDGKDKRTFYLDSPSEFLHIPPSIWVSQEYAAENSVLMVVADQYFDENDYIRNYNDFLHYRRCVAT